jgi:hypothetical protein
MKLYFAASGATAKWLLSIGVKNILVAFPDKSIVDIRRKANVFLDCGAYSAWTQNIHIDHREYMEFIKGSGIKRYASLDVVVDWKQSMKNFKIELKAGLNPIPCYHYGEPIRVLEQYCEMTNHVAIGGLSTLLKFGKLTPFLDSCFSIAAKRRTPFHGYAVNTVSVMEQYPWASVDSTTWNTAGKYGRQLKKDGTQTPPRSTLVSRKKIEGLTQSEIHAYMQSVTDKTVLAKKNVRHVLATEARLTELWRKRGVQWD